MSFINPFVFHTHFKTSSIIIWISFTVQYINPDKIDDISIYNPATCDPQCTLGRIGNNRVLYFLFFILLSCFFTYLMILWGYENGPSLYCETLNQNYYNRTSAK